MSSIKKNEWLGGKVTIKEVAQKAGVSAMTVSRVMRNHGSIAKETKQIVLAVIEEMGYLPLQSARNLSNSFPRVIGMVIPSFLEFRELRQGYEYEYALMIGALNICNKHDYAINVQEIRSAEDVRMLVKRVRSRQIGGYIVAAPATEYSGLLETLQDSNIIFSTISSYVDHSGLSVAANESNSTYEMTKKLIKLGHRKIAFVGGIPEQRATRERQEGYCKAISECEGMRIESKIYQSGAFFEDGYREGINIFLKLNRPTAIQCLTDDIAAGVIAAANQLGLTLPRDLSICGFDNFGLARKITPPLTTAILPAEEMAEIAALQVINALERKELQANVTLDCGVVYRKSIFDVTEYK